MPSRTDADLQAPASEPGASEGLGVVPREEILAVAARTFRNHLDDWQALGYHYVVLRGDRLVAAGPTAEQAWRQARARGLDEREAFCGSVTDGCAVHPY